MSKQDNHNTNVEKNDLYNLVQITGKKSADLANESWERLSKLHRMGITVIFFAMLGILFTYLFDSENAEQTEMKIASNFTPASVPTQGLPPENKLNNVIIASRELAQETTILPEITNPDREVELDIAFDETANAPLSVVFGEDDAAPPVEEKRWFSYTIEEGDTLSSIFRGQRLSLLDLYELAAIEGADRPLSRIMPEQELRFRLNESADLDALEIQSSTRNILFVRNSQGNFVRQN